MVEGNNGNRLREMSLFPDFFDIDKYSNILLKGHSAEARIYKLLLASPPISTVEIVIATGLADPNAIIRNLRNNGIRVGDFWESKEGRRYKRFFLREKNSTTSYRTKRR